MEDIANNLRDPGWWFTAFFVAILGSVVAGFLKDKIEKKIGGLSSSLRLWREKKEKEQEKVIEALVDNETYLTIALFRVVVALILFAISVVLYSTSPVMLSMASHDKDTIISIDRGFVIWKIFTPILGVFTAFVAFRATSRISLVFKAMKQYRKKHGLPKIP